MIEGTVLLASNIPDPSQVAYDTCVTFVKVHVEKVEKGEIDPSFVVTHRVPLDEAPHAYASFKDKAEPCIKVVLKP